MTTIQRSSSTTPSAQLSRRIEWLDIAKGIAIILVVVGHTVRPESLIRDCIFTFHMPLFFILAGYTFKLRPFKDELARSAQRLLLPYVIIFFLWQGINYFEQPNAFTLGAFYQLAGMFIFASGSPVPLFNFEMVGMAWFLVCLFCARILMNPLMRLFAHGDFHPLLQFLIVMAIGAFGVYLGSVVGLYLPFSLDVTFVTIPLMWIGAFAREHRFMDRYGHRWYTVIIALAVYLAAVTFSDLELANRLYSNALVLFCGALAGTLFVCQVSMLIERFHNPLKTYLLFMGKNSMLVYSIHAIDWLIPWSSLGAFLNLPFQNGFASLVRIAYVSLFALLVRRV